MSIIDTHLHIITPDFIEAVRSAGSDAAGLIVPPWSPEIALSFMNSRNIEKGILSYTSPGPKVGGNALVRRTNEKLRDIVGEHKERFGWFASLPDWDSPDGVDAVLEEAEWAMKEARADGLSIMTSYNDKSVLLHSGISTFLRKVRPGFPDMKTFFPSGKNSTSSVPSSSCIPPRSPCMWRRSYIPLGSYIPLRRQA